MAYCVSCQAEYRSDVSVCADCGGSLEASPTPSDGDKEAYVEVFSTDNREDIVTATQVLDEASVEHFVRDLEAVPFPTHMGSEQRLAVSARQLDVAHALIKEAIEDGAISTRGALLA